MRHRVWVLILVVVAVGSYGLGAKTAVHSTTIADDGSTNGVVTGLDGKPPKGVAKNVDFQQFWEVWKMLKAKYYKQPLDEQKMLYGAMTGLVASTGDPYTSFFEPKLAKEFGDALEGKFEGIGAEIGIKDDQLLVVAPLPDSPAAKAGLLPGDAILSINGTSTDMMTVERAVSLIRGPKGTKVVLSIGRFKTDHTQKGKPVQTANRSEILIVRDTITVKSVRTKFLPSGIAMIEIVSFNTDTTEEFSKAVDQVLAKDPKGLILDMRSNPGGFLDRATAVAGEWVGDQVVVSERRQGVTIDEYRGTGRGRLKSLPTIVLVNEGSASAAEIVAGALQDYGMAKLVGKTTFGKGSVQDYSELDNGAAIKITVAEWLTPKGRFINTVGIQPDVTVDRTEEDYHADRDPQLDKAIELLTGASSTRAAASTTP